MNAHIFKYIKKVLLNNYFELFQNVIIFMFKHIWNTVLEYVIQIKITREHEYWNILYYSEYI